jgi:hypothetical protein
LHIRQTEDCLRRSHVAGQPQVDVNFMRRIGDRLV